MALELKPSQSLYFHLFRAYPVKRLVWRSILLILWLIFIGSPCRAQAVMGKIQPIPQTYGDITYGELSYRFLDSSGGFNHYQVILKIGESCRDGMVYSPSALYLIEGHLVINTVPLIFDSVGARFYDNDPCIITGNAPCFQERTYHADIAQRTFPGFFQVSTWMCCQVDSNLFYNPYPTQINGIVYQTMIPGDQTDNSPVFNHDSLFDVHKGQSFRIGYGATDADGDSLSYGFCAPDNYTVFILGIPGGADTILADTAFPYPPVRFASPYSASQPLGPLVSIDPGTGLISGSVNKAGSYLVTVCATEYRNGLPLALHSKEFEVDVYDSAQLVPVRASIPPYNQCDSFRVRFTDSSSVKLSYAWNLGDGTMSSQYAPTHTYADTGVYPIRLIVNPGLYCADTAYSTALIYPGLTTRFTSTDTCINQQVQFTGTASSPYGILDYYHWNFGDNHNPADTMNTARAAYRYTIGDTAYLVSFTAGTDRGCRSTRSREITVYNNPLIDLVKDTVITLGQPFKPDPLAYSTFLSPVSGYSYQWFPAGGLDNPLIRDPVISGNLDNTYYLATQNEHGCLTMDTLRIKYVRGPEIYVPNAFTPNGDGRNDIFRPIPVGIITLIFFRVFDRWGNQVYQTREYMQGWDGTINGSPAPVGSYVWEVQGKDENGRIFFKSGTVILIR